MPPLPTSRAFLTNLLNTFSALAPSANPLPTDTTPTTAHLAGAKPLLLTLHALFPTTLLPALDLLDRRLVTKLLYAPSSSSAGQVERRAEGAAGSGRWEKRVVYYVQSAAQRDGRRGGRGDTSYEVRTRGWSCSCAAFAFAAVGATDWGGGCEGYDGFGWLDEGMVLEGEEGLGDGDGGRWGGLAVEGQVPLCKHLLACVLAERWDVAGVLVEEREVGREELAGWAAGWGG